MTRILAAPDVDRPNGILVSPGDRYLYIADNNNNTPGARASSGDSTCKPDGTADPRSRKLIFDWHTARGPDGFKMDRKGLLYVAAGLNKPNPPVRDRGRIQRRRFTCFRPPASCWSSFRSRATK